MQLKAQLTPQEYYDELYATFKEYVADLKEVTELQTKVKTIADVQSLFSKSKEICEKAEKTLNKFAKMNPPSQFADKHKKLLSAVDTEKKFINAVMKVFTSKSLDELAKNTKEATEITTNVSAENQFAAVCASLILEVKRSL